VELEFDDSVTVQAIAGRLGIPENALYLAVLNGKPVPLAARLVDGGHLQLFPPVVGG
jgi:sulfur carrier protein ThiS